MQKTVPFKKDIIFDNNIAEINSISLEHSIKEKKGHLISGNFMVAGDYKMTNTSENLDTFEYELPFNINIDKKYDIDKASIDISDFYYEVVNNKVLSVNIELEIDNIQQMQTPLKEESVAEEVIEQKPTDKEDREIENNLFDNLDNNEKYVTYKIHIVTENDTAESIMLNYEVTKEQLENYNNLTDIKIGDKLIVPANEN